MGKKDKKKSVVLPNPTEPAPASWSLSPRGWKIGLSGALLVLVGYGVLSLTDPAGQNWASTLSPFLLIGGYALIGLALLF
jgi:hypothetical protein